jgi:folylpolyglutamate synthase/dihydropteroate synthase
MSDKDVDSVIEAMRGSAGLRGATVIATAVDARRAMPAPELAERWRRLVPGLRIVIEPDVGAAVDRATHGADGPVVVAGSLYLVGAARASLVDDPASRDPVP